MEIKNWAGNYTYQAAALETPRSTEELRELVRRSEYVKALGSRHCFNDIADVDGGVLVSLEHLASIDIDPEARTVMVGGGVRYGDLCEELNRSGWALHNLASLPHISVAGACATATHGSGVGNGNLATSVAAMEIVDGNGDVVRVAREDGERFRGAVVGLGALGVVSSLTLDIEPAYEMRQDVFLDLPFAGVGAHFDDVMSSGYSVSLFTDWRNERFTQAWLKSRVDAGDGRGSEPEFFGARRAVAPVHPLAGADPVNCTQQLGVAGPWQERLPHFRYGFKPSNGDELQSEYFVPCENAVDALRAMWGLGGTLGDALLVSEIRTIAADDFWMSPCYRQDCASIHFTWKKDGDRIARLLPLIEAALDPFDARPHWGKLFTTSPERLARLYPRLVDFRGLVEEFNAGGKFRNAYLDHNVFTNAMPES